MDEHEDDFMSAFHYVALFLNTPVHHQYHGVKTGEHQRDQHTKKNNSNNSNNNNNNNNNNKKTNTPVVTNL